jgi:hypothetical protein
MNRLFTSLCLLAGIAIGGNSLAQTVTPSTPSSTTTTVIFDGATNLLTMPSVTAGDYIYNNLVIRLEKFTVVSVGTATPVTPTTPTTPTTPATTEKCAAANFTRAKYDAIAVGMTFDQVTQTIGCAFDPTQTTKLSTFSRYSWISLPTLINVYFDPEGKIVTATSGGGTYKVAVGF